MSSLKLLEGNCRTAHEQHSSGRETAQRKNSALIHRFTFASGTWSLCEAAWATANEPWTAQQPFWKHAPAPGPSGAGTGGRHLLGPHWAAAGAVAEVVPHRWLLATRPPSYTACWFTFAAVSPLRRARSCAKNGWILLLERMEGVRMKVRVKNSAGSTQDSVVWLQNCRSPPAT